MFNFNLEPVGIEKIQVGKLYVDMPIYHDILGNEFDVIEKYEYMEMEWNQQLLSLTEKIAKSKGLTMYEVSQQLIKVELETDEAKKLDLLGEYLYEFISLVNRKPNQRKANIAIVTEVLKRVKENITTKEVEKFPVSFLATLKDFIYQEQAGEKTLSYREMQENLETAEKKLYIAEETLKAISSAISKPDKELPGKIAKIIEHSFTGEEIMGKQYIENGLSEPPKGFQKK